MFLSYFFYGQFFSHKRALIARVFLFTFRLSSFENSSQFPSLAEFPTNVTLLFPGDHSDEDRRGLLKVIHYFCYKKTICLTWNRTMIPRGKQGLGTFLSVCPC